MIARHLRGSIGVFGAIVACAFCVAGAGAMSAQATVPVRTVEKGANSNVDDARQVVARTQAEWAALWKKHEYDRPAPKVDFSKEMVVAVFMGSRPTAGFATEIVSAAEQSGGLVVTYKEAMPAGGAITAQVLTAPFHIAAVPKHAGDVKFQKAQ
jgi:hypothetical protein